MHSRSAMPSSLFILSFLLLFSCPSTVTCRSIFTSHKLGDSELKRYIVQVLPPKEATFSSSEDLEAWYRSFLPATTSNSDGGSRMVFAYTEVFSGFAAMLTEAEVEDMGKKPGFVRAFPEQIIPLATTHTPKLLGLRQGSGLWNSSRLGKGVIIGMLDTGVNPNHPSFGDEGLPQPPTKWKGTCEFKSCNNKIIGARSFLVDGKNGSARGVNPNGPFDEEGHGSHTASTAGGNFVKNANLLGQANGTAAGVAPHAHLAIYQVCDAEGCPTAAILAALDAGVKDGVDILSLSLGGSPNPFHSDPLAIGAFGATNKGIFVSCAAGNTGPDAGTLSNGAPWILTVAASTVDRSLKATVKLGNGKKYDGQSLVQPKKFSSKQFPLVIPIDAAADCSYLDGVDVTGKVVVCAAGGVGKVEKGQNVKAAGGVAAILVNDETLNNTILSNILHVLPVSEVPYTAGQEIISYYNSAKTPTATIIFTGTVIGTSPAPTVASFSSRGPNTESPLVLKPDISGPGVNILAAWPVSVGSEAEGEAYFNILSGTSMSTPHLSGVAALLKSAHPDWSPAAIKSAIITTSDANDNTGEPIKDQTLETASFFSKGAGHVNPSKAADPGLVFDIEIDDYIGYLCGLYGDHEVRSVVRRSISCSDFKDISESELNYPSITVSSGEVTVSRTATNVGDASSKYEVEVDVPTGMSVTVKPETLEFSKKMQKKTFTVTVNGSGGSEGNLKLVSDDKKHIVRLPIVVSMDGVANHSRP